MTSRCLVLAGAALLALWTGAPAQERKAPDAVAHRKATIISEGSRLSADLYSLEENKGKAGLKRRGARDEEDIDQPGDTGA